MLHPLFATCRFLINLRNLWLTNTIVEVGLSGSGKTVLFYQVSIVVVGVYLNFLIYCMWACGSVEFHVVQQF